MNKYLPKFLTRGSVARQITVACLLIFIIMAIINSVVVWKKSTVIMQHEAIKTTIEMNESYFDALNTLMLTGSMDQREILRNKFLRNPDILDLRVIRGSAVTAQFGEPLDSEIPHDEIDKLVLQGKKNITIHKKDGKKILTVALPYIATNSTRGVNCLECHQVPSGTVNGAIRIDYDLGKIQDSIDDAVKQDLLFNIIIMLLGIICLSLFMKRNLTKGIEQAIDFSKSISNNNFDYEVPSIRRDNLGRLMYIMIQMRTSLQKQFTEIKALHDEDAVEMEEKFAHQKKEANLVVAFESGIVTVVENLNEVSSNVSNSALLLAECTTNINQNSSAATVETNDVLKQVSDTSSSTQEIATAFKDIEERGHEAIAISERASADALATSERMETLQTASDDIGSVIATITEIASKTNLLALNATIEAARAGDVGRGFAVVASEVKSLANQTTQATEVIATQIKEVQDECRNAIASIQGINKIILQMNEHTHDVAKIMQQYTGSLDSLEMNAGAANQGIQSVITTIQDVNQSAEKSDEISNQVNEYCALLKNTTLEQEQLVNQFLSMLENIRNNTDDVEDDDDDLF